MKKIATLAFVAFTALIITIIIPKAAAQTATDTTGVTAEPALTPYQSLIAQLVPNVSPTNRDNITIQEIKTHEDGNIDMVIYTDPSLSMPSTFASVSPESAGVSPMVVICVTNFEITLKSYYQIPWSYTIGLPDGCTVTVKQKDDGTETLTGNCLAYCNINVIYFLGCFQTYTPIGAVRIKCYNGGSDIDFITITSIPCQSQPFSFGYFCDNYLGICSVTCYPGTAVPCSQ